MSEQLFAALVDYWIFAADVLRSRSTLQIDCVRGSDFRSNVVTIEALDVRVVFKRCNEGQSRRALGLQAQDGGNG